MIEAGLIASRFLHYIAVLALFGAAVFPLYAYGTKPHAFLPAQDTIVRRLRALLWVAAILALAGGIGWFVFTTAAMADDIAALRDLAVWRAVIEATAFGPLWIVRLAVTAMIMVLLLHWPRAISFWSIPFLSLLLLASLAATGHANATPGLQGTLHQVADALHLAAAGVWLGGLWPLGLALAAQKNDDEAHRAVADMLMRFSRIGIVAVAVLVASGLVNSWFLVGSLHALGRAPYGQLLLVKLALFSFMALLAAANRFWVTPKFTSGTAASNALWLRRIRRHVMAEQALGVLVLATVSLLGTLEPALQS